MLLEWKPMRVSKWLWSTVTWSKL